MGSRYLDADIQVSAQDSDDEPGDGCGTDVRLKNVRIGLVYHGVAAPPASEKWGVAWDGVTPFINIYLVMLFNGICRAMH
jgi:hypothetical protein